MWIFRGNATGTTRSKNHCKTPNHLLLHHVYVLPESQPELLLDLLVDILAPLPQFSISTLIGEPCINSGLQLSDWHKIPALTLLYYLRTCCAEERVQSTFMRRNRRGNFHHETLETSKQRRVLALKIRFDHTGMEGVGCQT
jgi:hypothetical protein